MATEFWSPRSPGEAIRILRERMGLNQKELAAQVTALGVKLTPEHLSKIESGARKAQWAHLTAFAHIFDCSITDLMATPEDYPELQLHLRGIATRVLLDAIYADSIPAA